MRNYMKCLALLLFCVTTMSVSAQSFKFGHIDLQALIKVMPEKATAEVEFSKYQKEIEDVFGEMQKNYQTKLAELEQMGDSASEVRKRVKVNEFQELQQRIQNYQVTAQQQLQQKNAELLTPVIQKAEKAIEDVAKEQGLIYVFETGSKVVLYKSNQSIDLLPLVKKKLGIQ